MSILARFVRWRWGSTPWGYAALVAGWSGLTWVLADWTGSPLRTWVGSTALFVLMFEVGLSYVLSAAWSGHPSLEEEAEKNEKAQRLRKRS